MDRHKADMYCFRGNALNSPITGTWTEIVIALLLVIVLVAILAAHVVVWWRESTCRTTSNNTSPEYSTAFTGEEDII